VPEQQAGLTVVLAQAGGLKINVIRVLLSGDI
jgi:hypothetical protein